MAYPFSSYTHRLKTKKWNDTNHLVNPKEKRKGEKKGKQNTKYFKDLS